MLALHAGGVEHGIAEKELPFGTVADDVNRIEVRIVGDDLGDLLDPIAVRIEDDDLAIPAGGVGQHLQIRHIGVDEDQNIGCRVWGDGSRGQRSDDVHGLRRSVQCIGRIGRCGLCRLCDGLDCCPIEHHPRLKQAIRPRCLQLVHQFEQPIRRIGRNAGRFLAAHGHD